ncbi:hypothetical protein U1Q18_026969 [Sarracenia purpurea var. burkii]
MILGKLRTMEPQMLLRKAIQKTKIFLHETLQNLRSYLFRGYKKLPKSRQNFSNNTSNMQHLDHFYTNFSEFVDSNCENTKIKKPDMPSKEPSFSAFEEQISGLKNKYESKDEEVKKIGSSHEGKREEPSCSLVGNGINGGGYVLAQKLKDLEIMDINDVDYVLDIEEVLHYYSRLTCPVYVDIVDKFFIDTCSEFFLPLPPL